MLCSADRWVAGDFLLSVKTCTYWNRVWLASCRSYLAEVHMDLTQKGTRVNVFTPTTCFMHRSLPALCFGGVTVWRLRQLDRPAAQTCVSICLV